MTIFRICSTFNATGLALGANAQCRARRPQRSLGRVKVALAVVAGGDSRGRRTDRHGMPNR